jgi:hypothetical protein
MASRRRPIGIVALGLVLAACTGAEAEPMAPPDVFAPTPIIGDAAGLTTTTEHPPATPTVSTRDEMAIFAVDELLDPLPGYQPIPMGDWFWGDVSSNGAWLALWVGDNYDEADQVQMVSMQRWEVEASWNGSNPSTILVTDDGTVYRIESESFNPRLERLEIGAAEPEIVADLPPGFWTWDRLHIHEGHRIAMFGVTTPDVATSGEAGILIIDTMTSTVTEIPLPGVKAGVSEEVELSEGLTGFIDTTPAVVWDEARYRALIVHADEDVITEVDLNSGQVTEHDFGTEVSDGGPLISWLFDTAHAGGVPWVWNRATAGMSVDGEHLYVAASLGDFSVDGDGWSSSTISTGIRAIETGVWTIIDRLDAPISDVRLSPDGQRILASGYTLEQDNATSEMQSSGIFVIDPSDLEVIARHEPQRLDQSPGGLSFGPNPQYGYVTSWDNLTTIDVIDLLTGNIVANRRGGSLQLIGDAGVIGDANPVQ